MSVTILDFYANWCGPCKTQDPILENVQEEASDVSVTKINVDEDKESANEYQVRSLPTLVILDEDDEMVERFVGVTQKDAILSAVESAR